MMSFIMPAIMLCICAILVCETSNGEGKNSEKLIIILPEAQISFTESTASSKVKVSFNENEMVLTKKENNYELRLREGQKEAGDQKVNNAKRPVEVVGPSLPIEVHLNEGTVQLEHWSKEVLVDIQKGKVSAKNNKAPLAVQLRKGEILVSEHQGSLTIDSYAGNVFIRNLNGNLDLDNFSGESNLEKSKGRFEIRQTTGGVKVTQSAGNLQFELGRASLSSNLFSGRVEGQSQEGAITVNMAANSEVNLKTQVGRVTVQTVPGIFLNLHTQEGEIFGPKYLTLQREGMAKSLKGRMLGVGATTAAVKGNVYIRTQEGAIIVK